MSSTWIAEEQVVFVNADGRRAGGRIAVGLPEWVDDEHARCAIALDGLQRFGGPIFGATPLQALMLALQMIGCTICDFIERAGRILDPDDDSHSRSDIYFGPRSSSTGSRQKDSSR